jgi:hypothetical protein
MTIAAWWRDFQAMRRLRRKVARRAGKLAIGLPDLKIRSSSAPSRFPFDCEISRLGGRYVATLNRQGLDFISRFDRLPAPLYLLSRCPAQVTSILVNLSDGDKLSQAPFAFSVNRSGVVPLPDGDFLKTRGFEHTRSYAEANDVPWDSRSGRLRWRGWTNGPGSSDHSPPGAERNEKVMPRIRMALILKGIAETDVAFVGSNDPELAARLRQDGLLLDHVPETGWIADKFALDIDGFSNAWSNFLVRLHLGCCVLKIDSQHGYRQWYYDRIHPWEHFVPVRADMTDLIEKLDWAHSNDARAREIAENGRQFARTMTFESETEWAVNTICAANGMSMPE